MLHIFFQEAPEKQWFIHVIFTKTLTDEGSVFRRGAPLKLTTQRFLDSSSDKPGVKKGTNLAPLFLDAQGKTWQKDHKVQSDNHTEDTQGQMPLIVAIIAGAIVLLIGLFITVIFIRHRRKQTSPPPTPSGTITVLSTSPGQTKVISNSHVFKPHPHQANV